MTIDSDNVQYGCQKRITNPEVIEFLRRYANNPFTPSPQEVVYNAYKSIGMERDIDDIFAD